MSKSKTPIVDAVKMFWWFWWQLAMFLQLLNVRYILVGNFHKSNYQAMSRSVKMPLNLSKIDSKTKTPLNSIIFVTIGSILDCIETLPP